MAKARTLKSQGWYTFADGYHVWYRGLSAYERKHEISLHGSIVRFEHTTL